MNLEVLVNYVTDNIKEDIGLDELRKKLELNNKKFKLNTKRRFALIEYLKNYLYIKDSSRRALSVLIILFIYDKDNFFTAKILGAINPFDYIQNSFSTLKRTLESLYGEISEDLDDNQKIIIYNIYNYIEYLSTIRKDFSNYKRLLLKNKDENFVNLLFTVETTFIEKYAAQYIYKTNKLQKDYRISKEQIASGVIFAIHLIVKEDTYIDYGKIGSYKTKKFEDLIIKSWEFNEIRELWPKIITPNFILTFEENFKLDKKSYVLRSAIEKYDESISICNVKELHAGFKYLEIFNLECEVFERVIDKSFDLLDGTMIQLLNDEGRGLERVVFGFVDPNTHEGEELLRGIKQVLGLGLDNFKVFQEEYLQILLACDDYQFPMDELLSFQLVEGFSLANFLEVHRVFKFISMLKIKKLEELVTEGNIQLYENSLLSVFKLEIWTLILEKMGISKKKLYNYLELMSWEIGAKPPKDLQYRPLFKLRGQYVLLDSVMVKSNVIRNLLEEHMIRFDDDGSHSYPEKDLCKTINEQVDFSFSDVKIKFGNYTSDIDVIIANGEEMFFFEVKNTLLPCSSYEERRYISLLDKATEQLSKLEKWLQDDRFLSYMDDKLKVNIRKFNFNFGILSTTRWMSGSTYKGYPVRHILELKKIFQENSYSVHLNTEREIKVGLDGSLGVEATVKSYLENSGFVYKELFNAVNKDYINYSMKKSNLFKCVSYFNFLDYVKQFPLTEDDLKLLENIAGSSS